MDLKKQLYPSINPSMKKIPVYPSIPSISQYEWPPCRKRFKFRGKKVANHSVRKTGIGRMLDSDLPETYVAQQEGMKCSDSLKSYKAPGKKHKLHIPHILDHYTPSHSSSTSTKSPTTQAMVHNSSKASSSKSNILQVSIR